ncbi:MAG: iron ABC transporter permease [Flavobacteriales bacterium]|nr:iron ABC transporter permease [Flavobacteriales bacterium]
MNKYSRYFICGIILLIAIIVLFCANVAMGSVHIPITDVINTILGNNEGIYDVIITERRLPEAVSSMVAGSALAVCGLMMQTLFRNPLADPSILGISSGSTLFIAILTFCSTALGIGAIMNPIWQIIAATAGSMVVLFFLLAVSRRVVSNTSLLITGIMTGYLTSALVSILQYSGSKDANFAFVMWTQGSFSRVVSSDLFFIFIIVCIAGIIAVFFLIRTLNALLLGENYARNMGINVHRSRNIIIIITALLTAAVTAYCGPIAFIGLAVPHIVRYMTRSADRRTLVPLTALAGACITLLCALIAKMEVFGYMLPINAVTSLIGAPIVIAAIFKNSSFNER